MITGTYLPPDTKRRVARATLFTERFTNPSGAKSGNRHPGWVPQFGFADEHIDYGGTGDVALATGTAGNETATATTVKAANSFLGKIISGHPVMLSLYACGGRDPTDVAWQIMPMPLRYKVKAKGAVSAGASGEFIIHQAGAPIDPEVVITAHYDWGAGTSIDSSHEVYAVWHMDEGRFQISCP